MDKMISQMNWKENISHGGCYSISTANILISYVMIACYAIDSTKLPRLHYCEAAFIIIDGPHTEP